MTPKQLVEKINNIVNTPYRNIFTFETAEQEAEYKQQLDEQIVQEVKEEIEKSS